MDKILPDPENVARPQIGIKAAGEAGFDVGRLAKKR